MKKRTRSHIVLLLLLLIGIGAAFGAIYQRIRVEEANKTYDIVMDYSSLESMVEESNEDMDFWLDYFRKLGVDKLAIVEETIFSLSDTYRELVHIAYPDTIVGQYGWQKNYPEVVQEKLLSSQNHSDILVICEDEELFSWILNALETRSDMPLWYDTDEAGTSFLFLTGDGKDVGGEHLLSLPLGLSPKKQSQAEKHGYTIVPRTVTVAGLNGDTFAQAVLKDYAALDTPYLIGGGNGILGYDEPEAALTRLKDFLTEESVTIGVVEQSSQSKNLMNEGLEAAVQDSDYNTVRVFTMWDYVQQRYGYYNYDGPQEITNCLYRAAYERNCRLIYLKMIQKESTEAPGTYEYVTDPAAYETMLVDFMSRMNERGYTMTTLQAAKPLSVSFMTSVLIAVGAVAAAVLLLVLVFHIPEKYTYLLTLLGIITATGTLYVMPNTGRLILCIAGGIVMPLLAVVVLEKLLCRTAQRGVIFQCILAILSVVVICLVGGLFAAAPLSDSAYMLEMELYRGVKVMQLVPIAGFACYMLLRLLTRPYKAQIALSKEERQIQWTALLDTTIRLRHLLWGALVVAALAILFIAGKYYLARTGHSDGVGVADLELEIRNLMELYLTARPRTKEFLIGYPCGMLYVWSRRKPQKAMKALRFLFGLGMVIGATSIVNTFLHIRTPFLLSLIRVLTGLGFGLVIGLAAVAVFELVYRIIVKRLRHV